MADETTTPAAAKPPTTEIGTELSGLPLEFLIAAPFTASIKAQVELGKAMVSFVNLLAYGKENAHIAPMGGAGAAAGSKDILTLPMKLERPVIEADGSVSTNTITVAPPLLGLVPIPSLLIESVNVHFSMEIHDVVGSKDTMQTSLEVNAQASGDEVFYKESVSVTGKIAAQRENTRSTDKTAKYDITVHAAQQSPTEGMAKLMDLLASTVEPIKVDRKVASVAGTATTPAVTTGP